MVSVEPLYEGHAHMPGSFIALETCPTCDQAIPAERMAEVAGKLAARDRQRAAELTRQLNERFAAERALANATLQQERNERAEAVERARTEGAQQARIEADAAFNERLTAQAQESLLTTESLREQLKAAEADRAKTTAAFEALRAESGRRELAAREDGRKEANQAFTTRLADQSKVIGRLREQVLEAEAGSKTARDQLESAKETHSADIARAVQETREVCEKNTKTAVQAEQAKRFEETQKLSEQLEDLQRQLARKTADELGEGAELDLFEELKGCFEEDLVRRVPKGVAGADTIHEVRQNAVVCGKIVYDRKNRKDFKYEYATKLRNDQIAERADHAILVSNKFPGGSKQLEVYDNVIIACPARVVVLVKLLREHIIQMHMLRASAESRAEKTQELYRFITSPRCAQLFEALNDQITKLEEIDAQEVNSHRLVWERRGKVLKTLEKAYGDLRFEIDRIIGVRDASVTE